MKYPVFRGGDRVRIDLPDLQQDFIKKVVKTGTPTVLVLLNGSAVAVNWENENIPAILEAWYPGQAAGTAIADVLFGDYNPAGRLPLTFYKNVMDIPAFERISLGPGESKTLSFELNQKLLAYWNVEHQDYLPTRGLYDIMIGSSSSESDLTKLELIVK